MTQTQKRRNRRRVAGEPVVFETAWIDRANSYIERYACRLLFGSMGSILVIAALCDAL